ncbi:DNA polymerase III subunit gamma/tau [Candidatus Methylacidiphilum infernorum]|uniref:DNA polymerase III subunit gamma/tau n=1 Tax=Candidatus Methylacidiphilum infernorum TaxID=511746 RepID=A0ABX7PW27_9BACT|nr:DNA polymerase III subunit gamma/tau [Candidatus Methylacidiphilum infernorum]QSR87215.1 DNA polymerase III subunit gamma/tau [Candidatus Methylacidiphilum infernorum]
MYQVFSRKYRPRVFSEVVGQEHVVRTLKNAIRLGRVAHAYLFSGPRGTGKTTLARILAKSLNCADGPNADFDPDDPICLDIDAGRSLDCIEIDGASNNGVDQVRELREAAKSLPVQSRYKIYIIDEVHMLTQAAFNALLKILEEPPAHVKFIFATTEPYKIPPTVSSRCQRFHFKRIPRRLIADHLQKICIQEKIDAERKALEMIADISEGALRDAEVALDQLISFYGEKIDQSSVQEMFGLVGIEPLCRLLTALAQGDGRGALKEAHQLLESGKDPLSLLRSFRNLLHDIALYMASVESLGLELDPEELDQVRLMSSRLSLSFVINLLEAIDQWENKLRYALHKEVLFEIAILELSQLKEKVAIEELLAQWRVQGEERSENLKEEKMVLSSPPLPDEQGKKEEGGTSAQTENKDNKEKETTQTQAQSTPVHADNPPSGTEEQPQGGSLTPVGTQKKEQTVADLFSPSPPQLSPQEQWAKLVESLAADKADFRSLADKLYFYDCRSEELIIQHALPEEDFSRRLSPFIPLLEKEVKKVFNKKLSFYRLPSKPSGLTAAESPTKNKRKSYSPTPEKNNPPQEHFLVDEASLKNDPLIKEALELFKGKILRVENPKVEGSP